VTVNGFTLNFTVAVGGNLVVGLGGNGSLTGNNNSRINIAQNVTLAQNTGSSGTVLITDQFSTMNVTNTLNVGYGGTGNLTIANNGNVTVSGNTTVGFQAGANGTVLVTDAGSVLNAGANLNIGTSGNGTVTVNNSGQVNAGQISLGNNGTVNLNSSGVLATSGLNTTGTGALSFNGGTLTATANSSAFVANFTTGQVVLGSNGGTINDGGFDVTINSPISGNGNFTKTGTGTVTLNAAAASNYTGQTNVNQGTLNLAGNLSQSSVVVSAGAIVSGNGSIGGSLTLNADGKIALNNSIGTLNVTGNFAWNGATTNVPTIIFQLGNSDNTSDRIAVGDEFTKGSGTAFQFDFTSTGFGDFTTPTIYTLITFGGTTDFSAGDFSYINLGASAGPWGYFNLGDGSLTFTVVPETANFALTFGAMSLLIAAYRRKYA
jgi:T5SS/PEP-CTERM-associated repeat protein/autotransporter-associated beta strand protein